jgi:hypothetical protein
MSTPTISECAGLLFFPALRPIPLEAPLDTLYERMPDCGPSGLAALSFFNVVWKQANESERAEIYRTWAKCQEKKEVSFKQAVAFLKTPGNGAKLKAAFAQWLLASEAVTRAEQKGAPSPKEMAARAAEKSAAAEAENAEVEEAP